MTHRETFRAKFQVHPDEDDLLLGEFEGVASLFNSLITGGMVADTIIEPGAFSKTLGERAGDIKLLWQHDVQTPIGKPVILKETSEGLFLRGKISPTQAGKDALTLLRDGVIDQLSIGFDPIQWTMEERDGKVVRHLNELKLYEISLVTFAADPNARIQNVHTIGRSRLTPDRVATMLREGDLMLADLDLRLNSVRLENRSVSLGCSADPAHRAEDPYASWRELRTLMQAGAPSTIPELQHRHAAFMADFREKTAQLDRAAIVYGLGGR
jgi:HK97 family phage prohead protease